MVSRAIDRLARFLASLRLAVSVIVALAVSLATATILESIYDTPTARYWVYDSFWFAAILTLLGLNIFTVALSRWPWKKRHIPFLLAHAGILMILGGSWATRRFGADGSIRLSEGEALSWVELDEAVLHVVDHESVVTSIPVKWVPPGVRFNPVQIPGHDLKIDAWIAHAEPSLRFSPASPGQNGAAAIHFRLQGGPMRIVQDVWLWGGDPAWSSIPMGPARFNLFNQTDGDPLKLIPMQEGEARLDFRVLKDGGLAWSSLSRRGEKKNGEWKKGPPPDALIDPGWKGVTMTVLEWIPQALNDTTYIPSRIQYGERAPPSAIRLATSRGGKGGEIWLGMGDQAKFLSNGNEITITYRRRAIGLPFRVGLDRFEIHHDPGTRSAAEYRSQVRFLGEGDESPRWISMNEPQDRGGYTFYQASYEPAEPRPVVTILSVNRDPGRWIKYSGSILLVLGTILLFVFKLLKRARSVREEIK